MAAYHRGNPDASVAPLPPSRLSPVARFRARPFSIDAPLTSPEKRPPVAFGLGQLQLLAIDQPRLSAISRRWLIVRFQKRNTRLRVLSSLIAASTSPPASVRLSRSCEPSPGRLSRDWMRAGGQGSGCGGGIPLHVVRSALDDTAPGSLAIAGDEPRPPGHVRTFADHTDIDQIVCGLPSHLVAIRIHRAGAQPNVAVVLADPLAVLVAEQVDGGSVGDLLVHVVLIGKPVGRVVTMTRLTTSSTGSSVV